MKLIGYLLMTVALVLGTIAATTAYLPKLDDSLAGLELNGPTGAVETAAGVEPIADKNDVLTPELIQQLRDNGVERVRVKEFSFGRWTHAGYFVGGVVLMIVGALTVRVATHAQMEASAKPMQADEARAASPARLLDRIDRNLAALRRDLEDMLDEEARLITIVDRVSNILGDDVMPFFDAKMVLIGSLGLAGFAGLMDRFSALERTLNRAWSAAADDHEPEAMACLDRAAQIVPEVRERLGSLA